MSILDAEQTERYVESLRASVQALEADLAATRAKLREVVEERDTGWRRACACKQPDPVMQADGKFYCYRCSFETGTRPNCLEPEDSLAQAQARIAALEQERDSLRAFFDVVVVKHYGRMPAEVQAAYDRVVSHA